MNCPTHCPYCGSPLDALLGQYGSLHLGTDHFYKFNYDEDEGVDEQLTLKGITYYRTDVARVCKLKVFS